MLTAEGCAKRKSRLWENLPEDIQWAIVADPRHINYFSAFWVNPMSLSQGERAFLFLEREGSSTLIADNFTFEACSEQSFTDNRILKTWYDRKNSVKNRDHVLFDGLTEITAKMADKAGIVEMEWFPAGALSLLENIGIHLNAEQELSLGETIRKLRPKKESDEIDLLIRCIKAMDAGHKCAKEIIKPGLSEFEIYREVQNAALKALGLPGIVYGDLRATDSLTPERYGQPTSYKLNPGDLFILDYSVVLHGYRGDTSSTICAGPASDKQVELLKLCETALHAGEAKLKHGVPARDVYEAVASVLSDAGIKDIYERHNGHGLGLGQPEPPIIVANSSDVLEADNVITLEPSAYVKGIGGIRIEHNYLITGDGYKKLSGHSNSL